MSIHVCVHTYALCDQTLLTALKRNHLTKLQWMCYACLLSAQCKTQHDNNLMDTNKREERKQMGDYSDGKIWNWISFHVVASSQVNNSLGWQSQLLWAQRVQYTLLWFISAQFPWWITPEKVLCDIIFPLTFTIYLFWYKLSEFIYESSEEVDRPSRQDCVQSLPRQECMMPTGTKHCLAPDTHAVTLRC